MLHETYWLSVNLNAKALLTPLQGKPAACVYGKPAACVYLLIVQKSTWAAPNLCRIQPGSHKPHGGCIGNSHWQGSGTLLNCCARDDANCDDPCICPTDCEGIVHCGRDSEIKYRWQEGARREQLACHKLHGWLCLKHPPDGAVVYHLTAAPGAVWGLLTVYIENGRMRMRCLTTVC